MKRRRSMYLIALGAVGILVGLFALISHANTYVVVGGAVMLLGGAALLVLQLIRAGTT